MSGTENKRRVSLLENESRGGDTLEQGTTFQEMVVLSYIPYWLKQEGFDSLIRESIGDTEAKFYRPGFGSLKVFVEAKNHQVTRSEFWQEIDRFVRVDTDAANEYSQFVLASMGLAPNIRPVAESLRRVRDPRGFYQNSAILDISFDEFEQRVVEEGKSSEVAKFLFSKVLVNDRYNRGNEFGEFSASLNENLALDLRQTEVRNIYERLKTFIQSRLNQTITRREIETIISECLSDDSPYKKQPIYIHTAITKKDVNSPHSELVFDWEEYFDKSLYPESEVWNEKLLGELKETKKWILENRGTRRIRLSGNRRLSAALTFGSIFSAVAGFSIEMMNRGGEVWATEAHATSETPVYEIVKSGNYLEKKGEDLVVSVGIIRETFQSVKQNLPKFNLTGVPTIHLYGANGVISAQQANLIARQIKQILDDALRQTGAKRIHLFYAGPSSLALFIGHRLNAVCPIQCYEWVEQSDYIQTCLLNE